MAPGSRLQDLLARRVVVLDGAIGTMLPGRNKDRLVLAEPDAVRRLHAEYLAGGADLISTNTFRATRSAQEADGLATHVREMNIAAARLARAAADTWSRRQPQRPRFVAGVVGPVRGESSEARAEYREQAEALIDGGVDVILVETIVTCAQAADAAAAVRSVSAGIPLMLSATVGRQNRLPSGEPVAAFYDAVRAAAPLSVGLNCGFGARAMRPALAELARAAECYVSCSPNAGLPDADGRYPESASDVAETLHDYAVEGILHLAGGCCGTTPEYIRAIAGRLGTDGSG